MVLVASVCQSVMCILIPTALYSNGLTAPNLRRGPTRIKSSHREVGAINPVTPLDILLRQFAAANSRWDSFPKNVATANPTASSVGQTPTWVLYTKQPAIKIYGEGSEYRFPPFLEFILQRIQSFFSVYKYEDTSRPKPGSFIHEVEFIQPTKVTINEDGTEFQRGDTDYVSTVDNDSDVIESDGMHNDDIFDDGTGRITLKARA